MPKQSKKPTVITATELQQKSGQILRRAHQEGEQFIVERSGYAVVVILSVQDYEALKNVGATHQK